MGEDARASPGASLALPWLPRLVDLLSPLIAALTRGLRLVTIGESAPLPIAEMRALIALRTAGECPRGSAGAPPYGQKSQLGFCVDQDAGAIKRSDK